MNKCGSLNYPLMGLTAARLLGGPPPLTTSPGVSRPGAVLTRIARVLPKEPSL